MAEVGGVNSSGSAGGALVLPETSLVDRVKFAGSEGFDVSDAEEYRGRIESVFVGADVNGGGSPLLDACAEASCMLGSVGSAVSVMPVAGAVDVRLEWVEGVLRAETECIRQRE